MGRISLVLVAIFGLLLAIPASAQEKGAVRPGFSTESLRGQKVLLFRPSIWVGEQSMGGLPEPNADWTAQARQYFDAEMKLRQADFDNELIVEPDLVGPDAQIMAEHRSLFTAVAGAVVKYQFFAGNRLPTRKNKPFEWTLGTGTKRIAELTGARFGLFVSTNDQYGSTGRKIAQLFIGVQSGVHIGYAGLVDLETGELVWLNADAQMGGDVRTADGMAKRVSQLLEDYPGLKIAARPAQ